MCRDCKDKIREVAGEGLLRMVKFLGPMYAVQGESLRTKAAATLTNLATDNVVNAKAIAQLGESQSLVECFDGQKENSAHAASLQCRQAHATAESQVVPVTHLPRTSYQPQPRSSMMGMRRRCAWAVNVSCMALSNIFAMLNTTVWTLGLLPMLRLDKRSLRDTSTHCARGVDALLTIAGDGTEPLLAAAAMKGLTSTLSLFGHVCGHQEYGCRGHGCAVGSCL